MKNTDVPLQLDMDESYTLAVPADGSNITITAATVYGAYHALQTLSQLISFKFDTGVRHLRCSCVCVHVCVIERV